MSQSDDMQAIRDYIASTPTVNKEAAQQRVNFLGWYDGLSLLDRTLSDDTLADAKARRDAFTRTNVATPTQAAQVERVLTQSADLPGGPQKESAKMASDGALPILRKGSKGEAVKKWQRLIGVKDDGDFGSGTDKATRVWQATHGTAADGVVGTSSWTIALGKANGGVVPPAMKAAIPTRKATNAAIASGGSTPKTSDASGATPTVAAKAKEKVKAAEQAIVQKAQGIPLWVKIVGYGVLLTGGVAAYNEFTKSHMRRKAA